MGLHDIEWLREQYVTNGLSSSQIAKLCGCSSSTVLSHLNKANIPRRSRGSRTTPQKDKSASPSYRAKINQAIANAVEAEVQRDPSEEVIVPIHTILAPLEADNALKSKNAGWLRATVVKAMTAQGYKVHTKGPRGVVSFLCSRQIGAVQNVTPPSSSEAEA